MPVCASFLEFRASRLKLLKSAFNAKKIHTQVVLVYLQPFRRNSLLKMRAAKNCEKFTINPVLEKGVQGCSRLSMLTNLKSLSLVFVMICSKSVPICNRFHT